MFDFHTHIISSAPSLLNVPLSETLMSYPEGVKLSVGLHPWDVEAHWRDAVDWVTSHARRADVWAIGECGLDKVRGAELTVQIAAFRAQIAVSELVGKPMIIHCVKAFDELLSLRHELETECRRRGAQPQPWIIHGFRGKQEQAKQLMAKGFSFSFGHQYQVETLRFVFTSSHPFFLETDDSSLSIRQIYEQAALHLGVDVYHLESLCDPRQTIFRSLVS